MKYFEINFDGLVGPTHNYAGLSYGNMASQGNQARVSFPKMATLQGLEKMYALHKLGLKQGVLPPQERPNISFLKNLGFSGSDSQILNQAAKDDPILLAMASSAACMWTANAATVPLLQTPKITEFILLRKFVRNAHRAQEANATALVLQKIFNNPKYFCHHSPLNLGPLFGDEGAANHTRLCSQYGDEAVELFVYGKSGLTSNSLRPLKYPARQGLEACQAIARLHGLKSERTFFLKQNPKVIDLGVFHNDVISVGNLNVLFYHEEAFIEADDTLLKIQKLIPSFTPIKVESNEVSVEECVKTYLFNTQLLLDPISSTKMILVAPQECQNSPVVSAYLKRLPKNYPVISKILFFDLKQSMQNGGGPACLRLRVVLSGEELGAINQNCILSNDLYLRLKAWINKHYRNELSPHNLAEIKLLEESRAALAELNTILCL